MVVRRFSKRSPARFWGIVLGSTFYGFVMAGLLGLPARRHQTPAPIAVPSPMPGVSTSDPPPHAAPLSSSTAAASQSSAEVAPSLSVPATEAVGNQPRATRTLPTDAAASQLRRTAATQSTAVDSAGIHVSTAMASPVSADDLPHRCSDGQWTWQPNACPIHTRRVLWRRVWRRCRGHIDHLCR